MAGKNGSSHKKRPSATDRILKAIDQGNALLRAEFKAEIGSVRGEIGSVRGEIGSLRTEVKAEIAASEKRLGERFDNRFDNLNREAGARFGEFDRRLTALEK